MVYILQHSVRKPNGIIIMDGQEAQTVCCVHCRQHWIVQPGSGKRRGYCFCCKGPTCGSVKCEDCVPYEKSLDLAEKRSREMMT